VKEASTTIGDPRVPPVGPGVSVDDSEFILIVMSKTIIKEVIVIMK